jgi:hypothetical protein
MMNNALIIRYASFKALRVRAIFRQPHGNWKLRRLPSAMHLNCWKSILVIRFLCTTRRIELTESGQLLLEQTAAAVESLENSLESIRDQNQEPSGGCELRSRVLPIC